MRLNDGELAPHMPANPRAFARWRPGSERGLPAFRRGALAVTVDPPSVWRHGFPIALSPAEIALVSLIVRRGRAAHAEIAETLEQAGACACSLPVLLHRIRRKFSAAGAPDPIATIRNWGLMCRVEPDIHGSTTLWIGDSIPAAHP